MRTSPDTTSTAGVLVVDGNTRCRGHVAQLLRRAGYAVLEAANVPDALAAAHETPPVLVLLEVQLPGGSGYELCRELRDRFGEELPIVFLTGKRTEPFDRVGGLLLGADDYIVKPFDADELIARVRRLTARAGAASGGLTGLLTPRELEVLALLVDGRQQAEIAGELFISPKTVGKHIEHILGKLGVHTRAQAVARAVRDQLVGTGVNVRPRRLGAS